MKKSVAGLAVPLVLSILVGNAWGQVQYSVTDLGTVGGISANGLNNSGQVVGMADTSSNQGDALLWVVSALIAAIVVTGGIAGRIVARSGLGLLLGALLGVLCSVIAAFACTYVLFTTSIHPFWGNCVVLTATIVGALLGGALGGYWATYWSRR